MSFGACHPEVCGARQNGSANTGCPLRRVGGDRIRASLIRRPTDSAHQLRIPHRRVVLNSGRVLQLSDLAQSVCDVFPTDAILVHNPSLGLVKRPATTFQTERCAPRVPLAALGTNPTCRCFGLSPTPDTSLRNLTGRIGHDPSPSAEERSFLHIAASLKTNRSTPTCLGKTRR
jgi:hypothetical protein